MCLTDEQQAAAVAKQVRQWRAEVAALQEKIGDATGIKESIIPAGYALVPDLADADEIVTQLYRRFKDWSKRGFGPDDVTWCEVRADVLAMLAVHHPDSTTK